MIRGAFILAVGFSLGYAKALQESDDVRKALADFTEALKNSNDKPNNDTGADTETDVDTDETTDDEGVDVDER